MDTAQHQMMGEFLNDEFKIIWKEAPMDQSLYYSDIFLEGQKTTMK
jgi:hypothetical protein